jgi:hypothetical protein
MYTRIFPAVLSLLALSTTLEARPIGVWSYEMLMEKSDVVLIGKVDSEKPFDEKLDHPTFGDVLEGHLTTFQVGAVLKGKAAGEKIELVHYLVDTSKPIVNGPLTAYFRINGHRLTVTAVDGVEVKQERIERPPDYLLFLKVRKDGRFEPVTGQVDSMFSARKIAPLD